MTQPRDRRTDPAGHRADRPQRCPHGASVYRYRGFKAPELNKKTEKQAVMSIINAHTGEVRSKVVPNVTGATLRKVMAENVDIA